jgi:hypothetical protein
LIVAMVVTFNRSKELYRRAQRRRLTISTLNLEL